MIHVAEFFIADSENAKPARLGGSALFFVSSLRVGPNVRGAIKFDEQLVRQCGKIVDKVANVALSAEVRAFML